MICFSLKSNCNECELDFKTSLLAVIIINGEEKVNYNTHNIHHGYNITARGALLLLVMRAEKINYHVLRAVPRQLGRMREHRKWIHAVCAHFYWWL